MIYNIQALRALAAYLVVVVHIAPLISKFGISPTSTEFGACGVDLFFVISGFVMVWTTSRRPTTPWGFFGNRLARIAPTYWLITFAVFGIGMMYPALSGAKASVGELIDSLFFIPYERDTGQLYPVLYVGWTLNYEIFFYLIFSMSILCRSAFFRVTVSTAALVLIVIYGLIAGPKSAILQFYTNPIIFEFAFGMWLGLARLHDRSFGPKTATIILFVGLPLLLMHPFFISGSRAFWSGIPSLAIVAASLSLESHDRMLRSAGFQLIGAASYMLYLVHPIVLSAFTKVAARLSLLQSPAGSSFSVIIAFALVGLVAIALHLLIERPIGRGLRRLMRHPESSVDESEAALLQGVAKPVETTP
jgi:peptidoglycan/LPS O-acetylase OafA/YrhL